MTIRTPYTPLGRPRGADIGDVVVDISSGQVTVHLEAGYYQSSVIGAGGGGGGGTWKSGHKHAGAGAGSGAGIVGVLFFRGGNYTFTCGVGGVGGAAHSYPGEMGHDGTPTLVQKEGNTVILAGAGTGGWGARNPSFTTPEGSTTGQGGILSISDEIRVNSFSIKQNGNGAGNAYGSAAGAAVDGVHGAGGGGVYKGNGTKGGNGYIKLVYLGESAD